MNHMKPVITLCGQNGELLKIKANGKSTYSGHLSHFKWLNSVRYTALKIVFRKR